jgi:5,10-methenyltetrahydrofolate synthetase
MFMRKATPVATRARSFADELQREVHSLSEFRQSLKTRQKEAARRHGPWAPIGLQAEYFGKAPSVVGAFSPRLDWHEASLMPALPREWSCSFALPRIEKGAMVFRELRPELALVPNSFGILEPPDAAPLVQPDFLFVPALTVDRYGRRVGRGGGFYDRYLEQNPHCKTLAVIFDDYVSEQLDPRWVQAHDRQVGALVTNSEFHPCGGNLL